MFTSDFRLRLISFIIYLLFEDMKNFHNPILMNSTLDRIFKICCATSSFLEANKDQFPEIEKMKEFINGKGENES